MSWSDEPAFADLEVSDWQADNQDLLDALQAQSSSSYLIQVFVLIAVALGIASTLAISAVQKTRQIGILKAMGLRDGRAARVFVWQALMLGAGGATLGLVAGIGLIELFNLTGGEREGSFPIEAAAGLRGDLVHDRRAGRAAVGGRPVAAHVTSRPDRGDPECLRRFREWSRRWTELLVADGLGKTYGTVVTTRALSDVSFTLERGEFASVVGQSGSGKSTLLNLIGLLDTPTDGTVRLLGTDTGAARARRRGRRLRNEAIGFVFQFHHLLPEFSVRRERASCRRRSRDAAARPSARGADGAARPSGARRRRRQGRQRRSRAARSSAWRSPGR